MSIPFFFVTGIVFGICCVLLRTMFRKKKKDPDNYFDPGKDFKITIIPPEFNGAQRAQHLWQTTTFRVAPPLTCRSILTLENDLKSAIANEDYAKAAELRDAIKIKKSMENGK